MRRSEPHHGQKRCFPFLRILNETQRLINRHLRTFALDHDRQTAVAREWRIHLIKIIVRHVFMKAHRARIGRRTFLHRPHMPFAEMPTAIARLGEQMGDCDFLGPNRIARRKNSVPIGMPAREYTPPRRRTRGMPRIKMIQSQPHPRHLIHHRRLKMRMPIVSRLRPAMIIAHQQDDVGPVCRCHSQQAQRRQEGEKAHGQGNRDYVQFASKQEIKCATNRI